MRTFSEVTLSENASAWHVKVENLRRKNRISLQTVADVIETSKSSIFQYFSGKKNTPPPLFYTRERNDKLANLLKTSPIDLWETWQLSYYSKLGMTPLTKGIISFIIHYPEDSIPKEILIKLLANSYPSTDLEKIRMEKQAAGNES